MDATSRRGRREASPHESVAIHASSRLAFLLKDVSGPARSVLQGLTDAAEETVLPRSTVAALQTGRCVQTKRGSWRDFCSAKHCPHRCSYPKTRLAAKSCGSASVSEEAQAVQRLPFVHETDGSKRTAPSSRVPIAVS